MSSRQINVKDRRAEPRTYAEAPGRIWYGPGYMLWADCRLKDLSHGGARIEIPATYVLPRRIILVHRLHWTIFEAVVKWRRSSAAGLAFEKTHDLDRCEDPALAHITQTWLALHPNRA